MPTAATIVAKPHGEPEPPSEHPPLLVELDGARPPSLLDPAPELLDPPLLDVPLLDVLLLDPPLPLELLPPAPASGRTKVQLKDAVLQCAPSDAHLQSVSAEHHPGDCAAGLQVCMGALLQSQTSVPQAVPPVAQSMSFVQEVAPAEPAQSDEAVTAVANANARARNSMANLLTPYAAHSTSPLPDGPVSGHRTYGCNLSTAAVKVRPKRTGLLYPPASVRARSLLRPPPGEVPARGAFFFACSAVRPGLRPDGGKRLAPWPPVHFGLSLSLSWSLSFLAAFLAVSAACGPVGATAALAAGGGPEASDFARPSPLTIWPPNSRT